MGYGFRQKRLLFWIICHFWVVSIFLILPIVTQAQVESRNIKLDQDWQCFREKSPKNHIDITGLNSVNTNHQWINITNINQPIKIPQTVTTVWYRITLPHAKWANPSIYFSHIFARSLSIFVDDIKVYQRHRSWTQYENRILIPLDRNYQGKTLIIQVESDKNRFGPRSEVLMGNHQDLLMKYMYDGLTNILMGCALIFFALMMLFASVFLNHERKKSWIALSLVIFILGVGETVYPNNLGPYISFMDQYSLAVSDASLFLFFPILTYFFEQLFGSGYKGLIRRLWQVQAIYSVFCLGLLITNLILHYKIDSLYYLFANEIAAAFCAFQFLILVGTVITYAWRGDTDAKIFTAGFFLLGIISSYDIIKSMVVFENRFSFWKWGVLAFVISLVSILGRRVAANYYQVIAYSKELEINNAKLDSMWQEVKESRDQLADLNRNLEQRVYDSNSTIKWS